MKYLVTGAAGFIGSAVTRQLLIEDHEVIGVDCLLDELYSSHVKEERISRLSQFSNFTFEYLDLRTDSLSELLRGVNVVINQAALPGLLPAKHFGELYHSCNSLVIKNVLEDLRFHPDVHLVHGSTSSVYGAHVNGNENQPLKPSSVYGETKLKAENLIAEYRDKHRVSATVLRYFSVYGPEQRPDMAYATISRNLIHGQEISISGDGKQTRTNTHIDDVVRATILAANRQHDGLIANICGSQEIDLLSAVNILAQEAGIEPKVKFVLARTGDQERVVGDSSRAQANLGWSPKVEISEGLRSQMRAAKEANLVDW